MPSNVGFFTLQGDLIWKQFFIHTPFIFEQNLYF